jgi:hypothetical protein
VTFKSLFAQEWRRPVYFCTCGVVVIRLAGIKERL